MDKLQSSLVNILVKVGLNEDTGLVPVPVQPENEIEDDELFSTAFESGILAAISADACLFPHDETSRDHNYPPIVRGAESIGRADARRMKNKEPSRLTSLPEQEKHQTPQQKQQQQKPKQTTPKKDRSSLFKRFGNTKRKSMSKSKQQGQSQGRTIQGQDNTRKSVRALKDKKLVHDQVAKLSSRLEEKDENIEVQGYIEDDIKIQRNSVHALEDKKLVHEQLSRLSSSLLSHLEEKDEHSESQEQFCEQHGNTDVDHIEISIGRDSGISSMTDDIDMKSYTSFDNVIKSRIQQDALNKYSVENISPPQPKVTFTTGMSSEDDEEMQLPKQRGEALRRTLSRRRSCRKVDLARPRVNLDDVTNSSVRSSDLPLSADVLNSLPSLCFPDGAMAQAEEMEPTAHFLVFTDLMGELSYATCLIYYTKHRVVEEKGGTWRVFAHGTVKQNGARQVMENQEERVCYLPSCLVLISKSNYFLLLKDLAARLLENLEAVHFNTELERPLLQQAALQWCRTPVPPSGLLRLRFVYSDVLFTAQAPTSRYRPVLDFPLHILFQYFTPKTVLQLMSCILLQQRIILLSSQWCLLTTISESLLHLLYPFMWHHTYVPILSWNILELVEAPGTFIMGTHIRHSHVIGMVEDVVLVDIDSGIVDMKRIKPIPAIPQIYADDFCSKCRAAQRNFDVIRMSSRTRFSYEAIAEAEHDRKMAFNEEVTSAALTLHVHLFKGLIPHIKAKERFFHKDKFLNSVEPEDKAFYKAVLGTELFNSFLKERMAEKRDDWTLQEEIMRTSQRYSIPRLASSSSVLRLKDSNSWRSQRRRSVQSLTESHMFTLGGSTSQQPMSINLPAFDYYGFKEYYSRTCDVLLSKIQLCESASMKAPLYVLLGQLALADGQRVQAVEYLQNLQACDSSFLQPKLLEDITQSLTDDEKNELVDNGLIPRVSRRESSDKQPAYRQPSVVTNFNKLPKQELDLVLFSTQVRTLDIAMEMKLIERLYNALIIDNVEIEFSFIRTSQELAESQEAHENLQDKLSADDKVQPEVFEEFYKCWKEAEVTSQDVQRHVTKHLHNSEERVLKISEVIKTSFGSGRIGLTQKRIFFLRDSNNHYRLVTYLTGIKSIEKTTQKSFFTQLPAVKLELTDDKTFMACVKTKQDLWYAIIKEMFSGKTLATTVKDPVITHLAAQNVLVIDAYFSCIEDNGILSLFSSWKQKLPSLCYYTEQITSERFNLDTTTRDKLQHRLDPSLRENTVRTVECVLYTPGNKSEGSIHDSEPALFCGLSAGKVVIFNASTWQHAATITLSTSPVLCLLSIDPTYVWAASFDKHIYVINTKTRTCLQTLKHHTEAVTGLCTCPTSGTVFSCSLGGEINEWRASTNEVLRSFSLNKETKYQSLTKIQSVDGHLVCCCREEVVILTLEGDVTRVLSYQEAQPHSPLPVKIDCFLTLPKLKQIWLGCSRQGDILIFDSVSFDLLENLVIEACGISKMVAVNHQVWVGAKDGSIHVLDAESHALVGVLRAHCDVIRSMGVALDRYVITGSGSLDGTVMIWRHGENISDC